VVDVIAQIVVVRTVSPALVVALRLAVPADAIVRGLATPIARGCGNGAGTAAPRPRRPMRRRPTLPVGSRPAGPVIAAGGPAARLHPPRTRGTVMQNPGHRSLRTHLVATLREGLMMFVYLWAVFGLFGLNEDVVDRSAGMRSSSRASRS
jgi:hypothetical protein